MLNVVLYGLEEGVAQKLSRALDATPMGSGSMEESTYDAARVLRSRPDLVFCSANSSHYRPLLNEIQQGRKHVPVVIVSEEPEFRAYADAMDRGATDFYHGPIDPVRLRLMVSDYASPVV